MSKPAVSIQGVSKAYRIGVKEQIPRTVFGAVRGAMEAPFRNFNRLRRLNTFRGSDDEEDLVWSLKDVSFDVAEGEVVGIIGRNGAGKSTLLKILSRITEPTRGQVVLRGRVSSLLEVGTGFHPEMTGRENVYMNGTILGMTKREIDRKFDEIVDFSGIEKFLDTPVKRYSSGMSVRLAFAVAAHLEPEILIIDEVLAVGDAEFQTKCIGKMRSVAGSGRTVLFVSHNVAALQALCTHGVVLSRGQLAFQGTARAALDLYTSSSQRSSIRAATGDFGLAGRTNSHGNGRLIIRRVTFYSPDGKQCETFYTGQPLHAIIEVEGYSDIPRCQLGIIVKSAAGTWLSTFNTGMKPPIVDMRATREYVTLRIKALPYVPGDYYIDVSVAQKGVGRYDYAEHAAEFSVEAYDIYQSGYTVQRNDGVVYLDGEWQISTSGPSANSAAV